MERSQEKKNVRGVYMESHAASILQVRRVGGGAFASMSKADLQMSFPLNFWLYWYRCERRRSWCTSTEHLCEMSTGCLQVLVSACRGSIFFAEPVVTVMKYSSRNPTINHAARFVRLGRISDQVATLRKRKGVPT